MEASVATGNGKDTSLPTRLSLVEEDLKEIKTTLGHSPDPARGLKGIGMLGSMSELMAEWREFRGEQEKANKKIAVWLKLGGAASGAAAVITLVLHLLHVL